MNVISAAEIRELVVTSVLEEDPPYLGVGGILNITYPINV